MKLVNHIHFRVFCSPDENKEKIKNAFLELLSYTSDEIKKEKIEYSELSAKGFAQKTIIIIEADLRKERHCNKFLKLFKEKLSDSDNNLLIEQINRIDENMNLFIRLEKNELIKGNYVLTDSGKCYHITMNLEAHPRRIEIAHKIVKTIFTRETHIK